MEDITQQQNKQKEKVKLGSIKTKLGPRNTNDRLFGRNAYEDGEIDFVKELNFQIIPSERNTYSIENFLATEKDHTMSEGMILKIEEFLIIRKDTGDNVIKRNKFNEIFNFCWENYIKSTDFDVITKFKFLSLLLDSVDQSTNAKNSKYSSGRKLFKCLDLKDQDDILLEACKHSTSQDAKIINSNNLKM